MKYGHAFSEEIINSEVLPKISKDLLPWLIKDRKEAVEGAYTKDSNGKIVHNGEGLEKAKQALRQATSAKNEKNLSNEILNFLEEQRLMAEYKVQFYTGKLYLLDKIIAETK